MPTISWFNGVSIRMFLNDHPPPHFHAYYEMSAAQIDIETGEVLIGRLPPRVLRMVRRWAKLYKAELMKAWSIAEQGETAALGRIPGLDDRI